MEQVVIIERWDRGYFFEGLNILISAYCVCADGFQGSSKLSLPSTTIDFVCFSDITYYLLILKILTETPPNNFLLCGWSMFSGVDLIGCRENAQELTCHMQAAFGMILQNPRRLTACISSVKIAALGSLKRVTEKTFKIIKSFKRSKLKL
jgi:hypothetical protein